MSENITQPCSERGERLLWGRKSSQRAEPKPEALVTESNRLRAAWMRHESERLDNYLVADVEDPRINLQSIISRSFLINAIWPNEFAGLIGEEFRFSICLNFILKAIKSKQVRRESLLDALVDGRQTCADVKIPSYLQCCFDLVSGKEQEVPDYISAALMNPLWGAQGRPPDSVLSTFEQIWRRVVYRRRAKRISVLEPACGSANDYRYLHSYGVGRFLEYTGFDICDKNIANAHCRFPNIHFKVGNIIDIPAEDNSYDFLFVHDLFEHLSAEMIDIALTEIARVTRKQACLCFFNMADITEHSIKPTGLYHWNLLSLGRVREVLMNVAREIEVVHIDAFLRDSYHCADYHNPTAYTLKVSFEAV
ncbi:MAG TPA: class I SAM-dependent methyltransferase [Sedimentisphaerales bacterium]|nr:class I SAM-dependent methyltransferase [Sedimentisphaerales bacterium]